MKARGVLDEAAFEILNLTNVVPAACTSPLRAPVRTRGSTVDTPKPPAADSRVCYRSVALSPFAAARSGRLYSQATP